MAEEVNSKSPRRSRQRRRRPGLPPGLVVALAAVVLVVAAAVTAFLLWGRRGGVELVGFDPESTATVSFAGEFPAADEAPLRNPLGIAIGDGRVFVAEADAGQIGVYSLSGALETSIAVPTVDERPAYPADVAFVDARHVAVVETTAWRAYVLPVNGSGDPVTLGLGGSVALGQPTAVAAFEEDVYVADGRSHDIKVYDTSGVWLRTLGAELEPGFTFVGGMAVREGLLYASDSNSGRVVVLDADTGEQKAIVQVRMQLPRGIAFWTDGPVVCDPFGRQVLVFGAEDVVVDLIADEEHLGQPEDIAWDADGGRAYVTDRTAGRVRIFNVRSAAEAEGE